VDDTPYVEDLEQALESATSREDLASALRILHSRADSPSLRTLEKWAGARKGAAPLSRSYISDVLRGLRFPKKAVLVTFVQACGISIENTAAWQRAWERIAPSERMGGVRNEPGLPDPDMTGSQQRADALMAEAQCKAKEILDGANNNADRILAEARRKRDALRSGSDPRAGGDRVAMADMLAQNSAQDKPSNEASRQALEALFVDWLQGNHHLLITGGAGCGKSMFLRSISQALVSIYASEDLVFAVMDPAGTLFNLIPESYIGGYAKDVATCAGLAKGVAEELRGRPLEESASSGEGERMGPRIVVLVDDYNLLVATGGHPLAPFLPFVLNARRLRLNFVVSWKLIIDKEFSDPLIQNLRESSAVEIRIRKY
jgi:cell division septum initiation protein DivIVA